MTSEKYTLCTNITTTTTTTTTLSIMYHTGADCNCIFKYFLFIIKNDLLEKLFISTDRTDIFRVVSLSLSLSLSRYLAISESGQKYALDCLSGWMFNLGSLICCKATVKTLILTVCLELSAVRTRTKDHTTT